MACRLPSLPDRPASSADAGTARSANRATCTSSGRDSKSYLQGTRNRACSTTGSDRGSLRDHDLTLIVSLHCKYRTRHRRALSSCRPERSTHEYVKFGRCFMMATTCFFPVEVFECKRLCGKLDFDLFEKSVSRRQSLPIGFIPPNPLPRDDCAHDGESNEDYGQLQSYRTHFGGGSQNKDRNGNQGGQDS